MPIRDTTGEEVIDRYIGGTVVLFTTAPTDEDDGVEVVGGAYTAQNPNLVKDPDDPKSATNSSSVAFGNMPECTVTAIGFKDSGGELLSWENLGTPRSFSAGETGQIEAGDLTISVE